MAWTGNRAGAGKTSAAFRAEAESPWSRGGEEKRSRARAEWQGCFVAADTEYCRSTEEAEALPARAPALLPCRVVAGVRSYRSAGSRDQREQAGEGQLRGAKNVSAWTTQHQHSAAGVRSRDVGRVRVYFDPNRQSVAENSEANAIKRRCVD